MRKCIITAFILMVVVSQNVIGFRSDYDIRKPYSHDVFTSLLFLGHYHFIHKDYPDWSTDEYLSKLDSEMTTKAYATKEIEYKYYNSYFYEVRAITPIKITGDKYSVFYVNPSGMFWRDNIADEDDKIDDIDWDKVTWQIKRRSSISDNGFSFYKELPLPPVEEQKIFNCQR